MWTRQEVFNIFFSMQKGVNESVFFEWKLAFDDSIPKGIIFQSCRTALGKILIFVAANS